MNPLAERLSRHITVSGPLTVAEYMTAALTHPEHGYYRRNDPLGAAGDFTTAPEISQAFGELIGAWLIDAWDKLGRPNPIRLVELGPGRGTLMADALRVGRMMPEFLAAVDVHLVEINPALRSIQAESLSKQSPTWHDSFDQAPDGPLLVVANEFFDALPIRQLVAVSGAWRERLVGWTPEREFHYVTSPAQSALAALLPSDLQPTIDGNIVEIGSTAIGIATQIAQRIVQHGGAALLIDYGRSKTTPGDTLQAVRHHASVPVLADPGEADLSAHVDFGALARVGQESGTGVFGPTGQGGFLGALGIAERAQSLKKNATAVQAEAIDKAVARLCAPTEMGDLFKVLAFAHNGLTPAGFV